MTLTSITAYRFWNWNPENDADTTALSVLTRARQADEESEFTQELRITSASSDNFEYSAGLYYFWEDDHGFGPPAIRRRCAGCGFSTTTTRDHHYALEGVGIQSESDPRINSFAAFGQATWHVTPQFDVTAASVTPMRKRQAHSFRT